jgi:hypothetical protein
MALLEVGGGVAIGFLLSEASSRLARREERAYRRREQSREREMQAVESLNDALGEAKWRLPMDSGSGEASKKAVFNAHEAWQEGYFRAAGRLRHGELIVRYRTAGWALLQALLDEGRGGDGGDLWIVGRAIDNARRGFEAFLLDEPLPAATFPPREEAKKLVSVKPTGRDYAALLQWLVEHPDPAEGGIEEIRGR